MGRRLFISPLLFAVYYLLFTFFEGRRLYFFFALVNPICLRFGSAGIMS